MKDCVPQRGHEQGGATNPPLERASVHDCLPPKGVQLGVRREGQRLQQGRCAVGWWGVRTPECPWRQLG